MSLYVNLDNLIDRLKASPIFDGNEDLLDAVLEIIATRPRDEILQLVRCKDCVWYNQECEMHGHCKILRQDVTGRFYCQIGSISEKR